MKYIVKFYDGTFRGYEDVEKIFAHSSRFIALEDVKGNPIAILQAETVSRIELDK